MTWSKAGRETTPQPDTVARLGRILGLQDQRQPRPGGLWIGVLGPLAVFRDSGAALISRILRASGRFSAGPALGCGGAVRQDALVDALWGGNPALLRYGHCALLHKPVAVDPLTCLAVLSSSVRPAATG